MPEINDLTMKESNWRVLTTTVYEKLSRLYRTQSFP